MKRRNIVYLIFIVTLALTSCKGKNGVQRQPAPLAVPVVNVMQQNVALESEYTGQTYGESDVGDPNPGGRAGC